MSTVWLEPRTRLYTCMGVRGAAQGELGYVEGVYT